MARANRPTTLQGMITTAIRIDNRFYKRSLEQRGHYRQGNRQREPKNKPRWLEPIEVDATRKQGPKLLAKELERRRKNKLCFEYGKEGHMSSFYRQD
jgi:hypothetical protein